MCRCQKCLVLLILAFGCERVSDPRDDARGPRRPPKQIPNGERDQPWVTAPVLVRRVIDGDTLVISAEGDLRAPDGPPLEGERVRLIGIDTPEIAHGQQPAECYGEEAFGFTRGRVEGRLVRIELDARPGYRDRFGRLLGYVVLQDEVLNERILRDGYARVFRQFDFRRKQAYLGLESAARRAPVGLWASCR